MKSVSAILTSLLCVLCACSSGDASSSTTSAAQPVTEGSAEGEAAGPGDPAAAGAAAGEVEEEEAPTPGAFFTADGSPEPLICATDADCVASGALDSEGCCWSYRDANAVAMSTVYRDWQAAHRAASCADVDCPPPPVPARPESCLFEVSCVEAQCQNACGR